MFGIPSIDYILYLLPGFIIGLTLHEYAHGWMADKLGDGTARHYGRLTLNPAAHVDPIGLIMVFFAGFGWAKPVPVNPYNLQIGRKQGMLLVALAGPVTNLFVAIIAAILWGLFHGFNIPHFDGVMARAVQINVVLAIFNLIPIPPLDGSRILAGLLPGEQTWLDSLEQYGFIILIALVFTGALGVLFKYLVSPVVMTLYGITDLISRLFSFW